MNINFFPLITKGSVKSITLLICENYVIIKHISKWSDVGTCYYIYKKDSTEFIGSANSVNHAPNSIKHKINIKICDYVKCSNINDLLLFIS